MYGLTYRSKAMPNCTPEEILKILSASRRNNKIHKLTGCLIYHKKTFIQILEGEKKEVKKTFKKISQDSRHEDVTLLWEGTCEERAFSDWNMAYHSFEHNQKANEIVHFEQNLLILSSLSKMQSASVMLFWKHVEKLIIGQKKSKFQNRI